MGPRNSSTIRQWGSGFHTMGGGIDLGKNRFRRRFVQVVHVWKISYPGVRPYPPRVAPALRTPANQHSGIGVSTPRGAELTTSGHHFRPRVAGVEVAWKDFLSGNGILSSPRGDGSMDPRNLSTISPWVGVSTPWRAVFTGEQAFYVLGSLKL